MTKFLLKHNGYEKGNSLLLLIFGGALILFLVVSSIIPLRDPVLSALFPKQHSYAASVDIANITDNSAEYQNNLIPRYEKYEVTFNMATSAQNLQMPYDTSPPPGVTPGIGITVNGEFSQDNFQTILKVPAFYYQDFDYQFKSNKDWIYPKNVYSWKLRFSPPAIGNWQYRIAAQDGSGTSSSGTNSFTVAESTNKGFIRNAKNDSRYFEFDDGSFFPGLGYNMNFNQISWNNPILGNYQNFQTMNQNGIQFVRMWLSQWGIFGSSQNPWTSHNLGPDNPNLRNTVAYPGSEVSMEMEQYWNPCMFLGWLKQTPAVKPGTKYKISIRYAMPQDFTPLDSTKPFGLVAKTGGWLWDPPTGLYCYNPGVGTIVSNYAGASTKDAGNNLQWQTLSGSLTTGTSDFLPNFYLVLENIDHSVRTTTGAQVFIDRVDIQEDLGSGNLGVNIVSKPSMAHHQYFEQRDSFAFDKVLDLAKANNIYLKVVGLEKNEWILNHFDYNGNSVADQNCCFGNNQYFYGNYGAPTKVLWLQHAWWRYMQARWGYSTNIQSWELLNEGDPNNSRHYWQAEVFGQFMKQFANPHLITTSFWDGFPKDQFWANSSFPNIDYADIHSYISSTVNGVIGGTPNPEFIDPASANADLGYLIGTKGLFGANKPTLRGETGFIIGNDTNRMASMVSSTGQPDSNGIWLHKFIWGLINSFGVYELSWWYTTQLYGSGYDYRKEFGNYYDFIKDVPLNNGNYKEASASASDSNLRVWGQKDTINKRAHLWVDNKNHTWKNVVDNISIPSVSFSQITLPGMPQGEYPVSWYNTYDKSTLKTENVSVTSSGDLTLNLPQALTTDIAVKIGNYTVSVSPTPTSVPSPTANLLPGDLDGNNKVDIFDYNQLLTDFAKTGPGLMADINKDGKVDIFDYNALLTNFGRTLSI